MVSGVSHSRPALAEPAAEDAAGFAALHADLPLTAVRALIDRVGAQRCRRGDCGHRRSMAPAPGGGAARGAAVTLPAPPLTQLSPADRTGPGRCGIVARRAVHAASGSVLVFASEGLRGLVAERGVPPAAVLERLDPVEDRQPRGVRVAEPAAVLVIEALGFQGGEEALRERVEAPKELRVLE